MAILYARCFWWFVLTFWGNFINMNANLRPSVEVLLIYLSLILKLGWNVFVLLISIEQLKVKFLAQELSGAFGGITELTRDRHWLQVRCTEPLRQATLNIGLVGFHPLILTIVMFDKVPLSVVWLFFSALKFFNFKGGLSLNMKKIHNRLYFIATKYLRNNVLVEYIDN